MTRLDSSTRLQLRIHLQLLLDLVVSNQTTLHRDLEDLIHVLAAMLPLAHQRLQIKRAMTGQGAVVDRVFVQGILGDKGMIDRVARDIDRRGEDARFDNRSESLTLDGRLVD